MSTQENQQSPKIDAIWFSTPTVPGGVMGVVRVTTEFGTKYYIGKGFDVMSDAESDAKHIAEWGAKFPSEAGEVLFK